MMRVDRESKICTLELFERVADAREEEKLKLIDYSREGIDTVSI